MDGEGIDGLFSKDLRSWSVVKAMFDLRRSAMTHTKGPSNGLSAYNRRCSAAVSRGRGQAKILEFGDTLKKLEFKECGGMVSLVRDKFVVGEREQTLVQVRSRNHHDGHWAEGVSRGKRVFNRAIWPPRCGHFRKRDKYVRGYISKGKAVA